LVYSDNVTAGLVVITSPPPGRRVLYGSPITVEVSKGPHLVTIPAGIVGESVSVATSQLQAIGLGVSGVTGTPTAAVTGTVPGVGQAVLYGGSVQLVTG
ncbi:MAG: PASTA domain-containing protein, partial [Acidimicrobiales bacterium]